MEYGILTNPTRDNDVYTRTVYSPTSGLVSQRWRDVNGNGTQDTGDAVTTYSYGTTRGTLGPASLVATGHLVSAIERPLQTAGETAADRKTSLAYNALGEQVWSQDSMGTVRQVDMDAAGRVIHDRITALDTTKLNGSVRRISTVYDARGMASTVTSWNNATVGSGAIVNQVQNTYDGWGLLERHAVDVNGAVGASGSVDDYNVRNTFVQYGGVGGGAGGAHVPVQLRRTDQDLYKAATLVQGVDMLYLNATGPSGATALMDDDLGRVTRVQLPGSLDVEIAEYRYLGVGTVVETDVRAALMRSRLHNATTPATYTNRLDRWNRPIREHWQTYTGGTGGGTTLVDFIDVAVTLNPDGMPLRRDGSYYPIEDSRAVYDGLGRIISLRHGTLDGSGGITIENGRREDALTFTQSGTVATWNSDLNFQYDPALNQGTTPNYSDLEETRDTRTLNLMDLPTARNTNNIAGDEYTIAYDKLGRPTSDGRNYAWVYDGFGRLAEARTKVGNALVKEFAYDGLGRVIGERYDTDATAGVGAGDPWYYKAYDGFSRHVATFRGGDASPKEIYTHHEMNDGGSQLAVRRDVDATGNGGWGGSSDGVLETTTYMLHRANGDVIAVVTGLTEEGKDAWPGLLRERMDYVPGGSGAEPMRFSPSDGYQIGGERGADGLITGDDYTAFINDFAASIANGATDLNNNGVVDGRDFAAWNAEWDSGAAVGRAVLSAADGLDAKGPGNVRGRSADAGVALDAQLSGKVTGADGETGRVRWAAVSDGVVGGGGGSGPVAPLPGREMRTDAAPCGLVYLDSHVDLNRHHYVAASRAAGYRADLGIPDTLPHRPQPSPYAPPFNPWTTPIRGPMWIAPGVVAPCVIVGCTFYCVGEAVGPRIIDSLPDSWVPPETKPHDEPPVPRRFRPRDPDNPCHHEWKEKWARCGGNPTDRPEGVPDAPKQGMPDGVPGSKGWCKQLKRNLDNALACLNAMENLRMCTETHGGRDRSGYNHRKQIKSKRDSIGDMQKAFRDHDCASKI
jgi:YD repeat-containing protein